MSKKLLSAVLTMSAALIVNAAAPFNEPPAPPAPVLPLPTNMTVTTTIINAAATYHMTKGTDYYLSGIVLVNAGHTLIIDSGVVVRGLGGFGNDVSVLLVEKGGKIYANGTAKEPVIFTANTDNVRDPYDLGPSARGLWGGVVICGYGQLDLDSNKVEGIPENIGTFWYGGSNDNDTSGSLTYVSIRHAGSAISTGNEVNGLTLCGVGRGTIVEHIEVFSNDDDGIEIFGGAVNLKWGSVAFCNDDAFDLDNGWIGKGQYWFSIYNEFGNRMGTPDNSGLECDGWDSRPDGTVPARRTDCRVSNFTFIGPGREAKFDGSLSGQGGTAIRFKDGMAGHFKNGIVMSAPGRATRVDRSWTPDAREHWNNGTLSIKKSIFYNFGNGQTWAAITSNSYEADSLASVNWDDTLVPTNAPHFLRGISRSINHPKWLDPRPWPGSVATLASNFDSIPFPGDAFFSNSSFAGAFSTRAFGPQGLWIRGWTALDMTNILTNLLDVNPTPHEAVRNGNADFELFIFSKMIPSEITVDSLRVYINGQNITSQFSARNIGAALGSSAGTVYRICNPDVGYSELALPSGTPIQGYHTVKSVMHVRTAYGREVLADSTLVHLVQ